MSIAPAPTLEPYFAPATRRLSAVATTFLRLALEYDAADAGLMDFLDHVKQIATSSELTRLRESGRAQLPWSALRARGERTRIHIDGVTPLASQTSTTRTTVRLTITTHTDFATIRSLEKATLTLVPTADGWKVDQALGAGL